MQAKDRRKLLTGLAFLAPNILGFLAFTIIPLGFSLVMAFTNWDLRLQNMFKLEPLKFVGLANFARLLTQPDFWKFLGNTLFFMMGIPVSIAASLCAALLLSNDLSGGSKRLYWGMLAGAVLLASCCVLALVGGGATAMTILLGGMACGLLVLGALGGNGAYRTLFYIPHFTSGVATFILWKKLYSPENGPVNDFLAGPLAALGREVRHLPANLVGAGAWVWVGLLVLLTWLALRRLRILWSEGEAGWGAASMSALIVLIPAALAVLWAPTFTTRLLIPVLAVGAILVEMVFVRRGQDCPTTPTMGVGSALPLGALFMVGEFICLGFVLVAFHLPAMAAAGLQPPDWLVNYHWAKPALMIMGLWAAIGSNNMLLYLAGLSNVPQELYEAADIDGASRSQKFWHVTWPQLAPTTFFIVVMSVIGGLQGGFDMARTMTQGGPAGATTTLSYFIYTEGFETGRLGYSSAVAWTLFVMVLIATLFNWKFGNRYVNE